MSPFGVVEWLLGIAPKVVDLGERIVHAVQPRGSRPKPSAWDRPHFWTVDDYDAVHVRKSCQWCKTPKTAAASRTKCKGPQL